MVREAQKAGINFDSAKVRALHCAVEDYENEKTQTKNTKMPQIIEPSSNEKTNGASNSATDSTSDEKAKEISIDDLPTFHRKLHLAATKGRAHDVLCFKNGSPALSVMAWNFMEWLPFRRMDLQGDGSWKPISWPLPKGEVRDVPDSVVVHNSVIRRMQMDESYRPGNLILGGGGRGVKVAPSEHGIGNWKVLREEGDLIGEVYVRDGKPIGSRTNSGLNSLKRAFT